MASIKVELTDKDIKAIATRVVAELKKESPTRPVIYTVGDVSKIMKLHKNTVLEHIKIGLLKASRVGKSYSISDDQLNEYINNK